MAGNDNYFLLLSSFFPIDMVLKLFLFQTLYEMRVCNYYDICQGDPCVYKTNRCSGILSSCTRRRIMGAHWQVGLGVTGAFGTSGIYTCNKQIFSLSCKMSDSVNEPVDGQVVVR